MGQIEPYSVNNNRCLLQVAITNQNVFTIDFEIELLFLLHFFQHLTPNGANVC